MNPREPEPTPSWLARAHWISTGLSIFCFVPYLDGLHLRNSAPFELWLLANLAFAGWRLGQHPLPSAERTVLKLLAGAAVLLIPLYLLGCMVESDTDLIFQDATSSVYQYRTDFSFGGGPDEEEIITTYYRISYGLYEEQVASSTEPAPTNR